MVKKSKGFQIEEGREILNGDRTEADNDYYIKAKTAQEFNKLEPIAQGILDRLDAILEITRENQREIQRMKKKSKSLARC